MTVILPHTFYSKKKWPGQITNSFAGMFSSLFYLTKYKFPFFCNYKAIDWFGIMLACLPALEGCCDIESLTLTNCDRLFYCHPIMRNKSVAEELMSGMFLLFLHLLHSAPTFPVRFPPPPLTPSIFIILPHPNNNTAGTQHKTRGLMNLMPSPRWNGQ